MTTESLINFLSTHNFKEWVLKTSNDEALNTFWKKWLEENPNHSADISFYKDLILETQGKDGSLSENNKNFLWKKIQLSISEDDLVSSDQAPKSWLRVHRSRLIAAASLILILSFSVSLYYLNNTSANKQIFVSTDYAETKFLKLPDGSQVFLNANSSISFSKIWRVGEDRQVTLKGEGYFIVNEQSSETHKDKFTVHTPELDVQVLGTRFNVNSYRTQTQVVLQKGSVELTTTHSNQNKNYNLTPGQSAIFDKSNDEVKISKVNSEVYVGWKDKKFVFDQTPLSEVAIMLENTYGIKVLITDKELAAKQISGEIPTSERKSLLLALSSLYSLKITEKDKNTLVITK